MKNIKEKIESLIAVIELTENKVGLETLKEILSDIETKPIFGIDLLEHPKYCEHILDANTDNCICIKCGKAVAVTAHETLKEIKRDITGKFKLTEDQIKQAKNTVGFLDWNTLTLDQMVDYLEDKYKYSSTGDAKCIYHLIEFYRKTILIS